MYRQKAQNSAVFWTPVDMCGRANGAGDGIKKTKIYLNFQSFKYVPLAFCTDKCTVKCFAFNVIPKPAFSLPDTFCLDGLRQVVTTAPADKGDIHDASIDRQNRLFVHRPITASPRPEVGCQFLGYLPNLSRPGQRTAGSNSRSDRQESC
jgi:hypothetical protein